MATARKTSVKSSRVPQVEATSHNNSTLSIGQSEQADVVAGSTASHGDEKALASLTISPSPSIDGAALISRLRASMSPVDLQLFDMKNCIHKACSADGLMFSDATTSLKGLKDNLRDGFETTVTACQAILSGVVLLKTLSDDQVKNYIEGLFSVNEKGESRALKYNIRARANLALPLALDGYRNTASGGHISKVACVVGYAHACEVNPDDFPAFLKSEHTYSKGKGYGLKHAYQAARDFFTPEGESKDEKAAHLRGQVLKRLGDLPSLATVTAPLKVNPSAEGLYCLLARVNGSNASEVVTAVRNDGGVLVTRLLDILVDQMKVNETKGKTAPKFAKPMSRAEMAAIV